MSFWRKKVIEPALDHETKLHIDEQLAWIGREPGNAKPYHHLAQLYRMCGRQQEALGLLLEAVRLDATLAEAHVALAEIYAVLRDYAAAWRHARLGEEHGDAAAVELLKRYGIGA
jgi:tetratricopeptide (TPR) repeat protein